jgi:hypothetical protein
MLVIQHIEKETTTETPFCAINNTYILRIKRLQYIRNKVLLHLYQERNRKLESLFNSLRELKALFLVAFLTVQHCTKTKREIFLTDYVYNQESLMQDVTIPAQIYM